MRFLIATGIWVIAFWLIRKDAARRGGISAALWIPTIWAFIALSRPLSMWLGTGGGEDSLEGSPLDRAFYFGMIFLSIGVLIRRKLNWFAVLIRNWPILLFYGFFLISVLWADSPASSFKRWFKDFGNLFVAFVILTERDPMEALRTVFVRCAYVLLPLSLVLIRYFPNLGRRYSTAGGAEIIGVTTQKNSLGIMVVVCGMILLWEWYSACHRKGVGRTAMDVYLKPTMLGIGIYLLYICNSQTSMVCLAIGGAIITTLRVPSLRRRVGALGAYSFMAAMIYFLLDWLFGLNEVIIVGLGRDMTFTGRTDVWRELLALNTDPLIGTGFCSFWSDSFYRDQLPEWVAVSAHNGYLETYIDGGILGLCFLALLIVVVAFRVNCRLGSTGDYAVIQFSVLAVILVASLSESHFGRMGPLWFLFLVTAIEQPKRIGIARRDEARHVPSILGTSRELLTHSVSPPRGDYS